MRKWEEKKTNDQKRLFAEEQFKKEKTVTIKKPTQPPDTLRNGFSWVNYFKSLHPNWDFIAHDTAPWTAFSKPLYEANVSLLTTAGVYVHGQRPFNASSGLISETLRKQKFAERGDWTYREIPKAVDPRALEINSPHYDHADGQKDMNCIFPLERFLELEYENYIGGLSDTHYGLMGYVPEHWLLLETTVPEIIAKMRMEQVDVAFITPGDPLSHQSAAIIQREIEAAGIATISVTVCKDITQKVKAPRAVALRFPLGNIFGYPLDDDIQFRIVKDALQALTSIEKPGTILDLPYEWVHEE